MTKRSSAKTYVNANVQYGTPSTTIANAAFGKKISDKFNFIISGNYQDRERFDETYYNPATGEIFLTTTAVNSSVQIKSEVYIRLERLSL
jgi:hypothetical protein